MRKKSKEDEQNMEEPVTLNELNFSCFCHIINVFLINRDLGQDSPIQTDLARLIRAKQWKLS